MLIKDNQNNSQYENCSKIFAMSERQDRIKNSKQIKAKKMI